MMRVPDKTPQPIYANLDANGIRIVWAIPTRNIMADLEGPFGRPMPVCEESGLQQIL